MNKKMVLIFLLCTLLFAPLVQAIQTPTLTEFVSTQLLQMNNSLQTSDRYETELNDSNDAVYFLRRFWMRVRAKGTITLPGIYKIQVVPEVEMLWERPLPSGWTSYKPR